MTSTFTKTIRSLTVAIAVFGALTAASTSGYAFSSEAQQMCTGDALRLCISEIPNIPKITACMKKNRSSLSTGCRSVMERDEAAARKSQTASVQ